MNLSPVAIAPATVWSEIEPNTGMAKLYSARAEFTSLKVEPP